VAAAFELAGVASPRLARLAKGTVAIMSIPSAPAGVQSQHDQNIFDTVILIGAMTLVSAVAAFQFLGWPGLVLAALVVGLLAFAAPHTPATLIMRIYRATPVDPRNGRDVLGVLSELSERAGLETTPSLFVIPSLTLNAFSVGTQQNAAIALTEGLLRKLTLRQTAGVLAHELGHIRNNDLRIMALADALTRAMQVLSWLALLLALFYVPEYLAGNARVPWLGLLLLYLAPTLSTLLQLALARTREFEADLEAVGLTDDPAGLASALADIEHYEGTFLEDLVFPSTRRVPQPSILRTHPATGARIERLRQLAPSPGPRAVETGQDAPRISLVGMAPSQMRPRYRLPGVWF